MENVPPLSDLLILFLMELVYHEETLSFEMQAAVVFVAPTLIKVNFQCDDGQILIYQKLHAMQDGM